MGTYTTNYNLFMPTIGEQGWGELVNGNFTTIDTTMKSLSNSILALETKADAMKETLDRIDFNADGSVNAGSATQLNKTVTVTLSSNVVIITAYVGFTHCPYVPGILYTGVIDVKPNSSGIEQAQIFTLNADNTVTVQDVANSLSWQEFSFSNAKYVYINNRKEGSYIHMPLFS